MFVPTPSVWYTVTTAERGVLTASACPHHSDAGADGEEFVVRVDVYKGSCGDLECVAGNSIGQSLHQPSCSDASSMFGTSPESSIMMAWQVDADETYMVKVSGFLNTIGSFELSVSNEMPYLEDNNDECQTALLMNLNDPVDRNFNAATDDQNIIIGCMSQEPLRSGLWFMVEGTGKSMTASTCTDQFHSRTRIIVAKGGCNSLECIDASETTVTICGENQLVSWQSIVGEMYYIAVVENVDGVDDQQGGGGSSDHGNFTLLIDHTDSISMIPTPPHATCQDGVNLQVQEEIGSDDGTMRRNAFAVVVPTLLSPSHDDELSLCGPRALHGGSGGIWAKAVGDGRTFRLRATATTSTTNLDHAADDLYHGQASPPIIMKVFQGECGNRDRGDDDNDEGNNNETMTMMPSLSCVMLQHTEHMADNEAAVLWNTEQDVKYHILILNGFPNVGLVLESMM